MSSLVKTEKARLTRERILNAALEQMAEQGFAKTTMRAIAKDAGVSTGLAYRYFARKEDMVLALYERLSSELVERATPLPDGSAAERIEHVMRCARETLSPHRVVLRSLVPVMLVDDELFGPSTLMSRDRAQWMFEEAIVGSRDGAKQASDLARSAYGVHLLLTLVWLVDRSESGAASERLFTSALSSLPIWLNGLGRLASFPMVSSVLGDLAAALGLRDR